MINPKYLNSQTIQKIYSDSKGCNPIKFLIWEDFIDPEIYSQIEQEILKNEIKKVDIHSSEHRNNKTVILEGEQLGKIFNFFESTAFEKYLSIYIQAQIKQEFYVDKTEISKILNKDFIGAVAQIYEKGDFFDWHVDGPIEKGSQGAFTYYLGGYEGDWKQEDGGNLELGMESEPGSPFIEKYHTIPYKKNTLVFIFASSIAYHRVSELTSEATRLSIQSTIFKA